MSRRGVKARSEISALSDAPSPPASFCLPQGGGRRIQLMFGAFRACPAAGRAHNSRWRVHAVRSLLPFGGADGAASSFGGREDSAGRGHEGTARRHKAREPTRARMARERAPARLHGARLRSSHGPPPTVSFLRCSRPLSSCSSKQPLYPQKRGRKILGEKRVSQPWEPISHHVGKRRIAGENRLKLEATPWTDTGVADSTTISDSRGGNR